jgi:hypothetical protein
MNTDASTAVAMPANRTNRPRMRRTPTPISSHGRSDATMRTMAAGRTW